LTEINEFIYIRIIFSEQNATSVNELTRGCQQQLVQNGCL